jgi:hypothetical protein
MPACGLAMSLGRKRQSFGLKRTKHGGSGEHF